MSEKSLVPEIFRLKNILGTQNKFDTKILLGQKYFGDIFYNLSYTHQVPHLSFCVIIWVPFLSYSNPIFSTSVFLNSKLLRPPGTVFGLERVELRKYFWWLLTLGDLTFADFWILVTFDFRQLLVTVDSWWLLTFGDFWLLVTFDLWWLLTFGDSSHLVTFDFRLLVTFYFGLLLTFTFW